MLLGTFADASGRRFVGAASYLPGMTYVDLRPSDVRPVRVLVGGRWFDGELEAYRRDPDGTWWGWVRWSEGSAARRIGWFGADELESAGSRAVRRPYSRLK